MLQFELQLAELSRVERLRAAVTAFRRVPASFIREQHSSLSGLVKGVLRLTAGDWVRFAASSILVGMVLTVAVVLGYGGILSRDAWRGAWPYGLLAAILILPTSVVALLIVEFLMTIGVSISNLGRCLSRLRTAHRATLRLTFTHAWWLDDCPGLCEIWCGTDFGAHLCQGDHAFTVLQEIPWPLDEPMAPRHAVIKGLIASEYGPCDPSGTLLPLSIQTADFSLPVESPASTPKDLDQPRLSLHSLGFFFEPRRIYRID